MSNSGTCMIKKKCYCSVKRFYLLKQDDRTEDKVKEKLDWSSLVSRGAEERQGTKKLKDRGRKSISSRLLLSFVGFESFVLFKRITDKMLLVLKKKKKKILNSLWLNACLQVPLCTKIPNLPQDYPKPVFLAPVHLLALLLGSQISWRIEHLVWKILAKNAQNKLTNTKKREGNWKRVKRK